MTATTVLSQEQIDSFKQDGYLILRNFIDQASLENWRDQIWSELGSSLETPETWPRNRGGLDGFCYDPPESTFGLHPSLTAIIQQFGGGDFKLGDACPIIRWPEPDQEWCLPQDGHIDAYGGRWLPFMVGATAYLYDVASRGGCLTVWPGSHHTAHRYILEHPEHLDGSFAKVKGFNWNVFWKDGVSGPREFIANAGDVVFWHSFLTHNGSPNVSSTPRIALFSRWDHSRKDDPAFRYEVPENLWKYWAV